MSHAHSSSAANLVGVHYRVGKKIGEGSFGVIFEGKMSLSCNGSYSSDFHLYRDQFTEFSDRRYQVCTL